MTTVEESVAAVHGVDTPAEPEAPARDVLQAISRVMRDLPGIGKGMNASDGQGGYAYRGIEQITAHAQVLCARHGLVFVPEVMEWERDEVSVGQGKVWHDERCKILYRVYGPGGRDDMIEVGPLFAIGRDGTDKGVNKCMTQAFKYALLQLFCIGDKADDNDGVTVEANASGQSYERINDADVDIVRERLLRVTRALKGYPQKWLDVPLWQLADVHKIAQEDLPLALSILDEAEAAIEFSGGDESTAGEAPGPVPPEASDMPELPVGGAPPAAVDDPSPAEPDEPASPYAGVEDAELVARVQLARLAGDADTLALLADECIERGIAIPAPGEGPGDTFAEE